MITMNAFNTISEELDLYRLIFKNVSYYALLINSSLKVTFTNYYDINPQIPKAELFAFGNILRCKNACESGQCGRHANCGKCIVRENLLKAFRTNENFKNVEAQLSLYDQFANVVDIDVAVNGTIVPWKNENYLLVCVRDITLQKTLQRRFLQKEYLLNRYKRENNIYQKFIHEYSEGMEETLKDIQQDVFDKSSDSQEIDIEYKSGLPIVLVVSKDVLFLRLVDSLIGRQYVLKEAQTLEEALALYINMKIDAVLISSDFTANEANLLIDGVHGSGGKMPILKVVLPGETFVGDCDRVLNMPLTQQMLEETLEQLRV